MKRRTFIKNTGVLSLATLITPIGIFQTKGMAAFGDDLETSFKTPPASAKPHTWWHWMNGNVTKEGITLDLEAMARVGIGGFQNFDAGTGIPKGAVQYLSAEWLELKKHTIKEAERLGLEFTMHNCPGWSSSGGPWITPDLAMQEITWSEITIEGGKKTSIQVPQPLKRLNFYRDIVVLACPVSPDEIVLSKSIRKISTNKGTVGLGNITGQLSEGVTIEPASTAKEASAFLQFEFSEHIEVQSISFLTAPVRQSGPMVLQASDNGRDFKDVVSFGAGSGFGGAPQGQTFQASNFNAIKAKFFRLTCDHARNFSQIRFSRTPRISEWQKRANYSFNRHGVPDVISTESIPLDKIIDVTSYLNKDGLLTWNPPKGKWNILRFGYTPIGTMNRSAPDTGVGLECDKYSSAAMEFHFNKMMESLLTDLKGLANKGKVGLLIDSYEVGMQNWTPGFEMEFRKRNSYDLHKYLPAVTGRVVDSADVTNRFLWDFRRTQGDLMADNYYGKFTALCHQHNMLSYIQPYDRGPMEEMQIGSRIDINVGEFWNNLSSIFQNNWTMRRTVKLSAAIAHTNGQKIVAAESYTGEPESAKWQEYPFAMKALGDKMFTQGLNRIVFHRFAHQPHPTARPGMTMGPWGIHFDRTNTWWEPGKAWMEYITRCQYLLQRGSFVADLVYFTGEDAGTYTKVSPDELTPTPPNGYDYDLINAEVLQKAIVENNRLILPAGISYRLLVLQQTKTMSLELLRKIRQLVQEGLVIVGTKPERTPGLRFQNDGDEEFTKIANEVWGSIDGTSIMTNRVGSGNVFWGQDLQTILNNLKIGKDVEITSQSGDAAITYIHRRDGENELFFLANQRRRQETLVCTFRVNNKQPELWDPVTGNITNVSICYVENGKVTLPIQMTQLGSVFVVFRKEAKGNSLRAVTLPGKKNLTTNHFTSGNRKLFTEVTNNFTLSCWVKPENSIMLSTRNFMDGLDPWTDNYAIYPSPGKKLYGAGHATCGLAVGRNGVAVWEHAENKPVFILAAPSAISGWSHVALVYSNGIPSVYINGSFIQKGEKSKNIVHPGIGEAYLEEGASYYNGDMSQPALLKEVLEESGIKELLSSKPDFQYNDSLQMDQKGSVKNQLVFLENGDFEMSYSDGRKRKIKIEGLTPNDLSKGWAVSFPEGSGAPLNVTLDELTSLHKHSNNGVKYFSGTVNYKKMFVAPKKDATSDKRIFLELGQVEVIAEVILNGKNLGILWARPYRVDITDAMVSGDNHLEIKVTNQWPNRLIGDEQTEEPYKYSPGAGGSGFASLSGGAIQELPEWYRKGLPKPEDGKVTFATWKHYQKDSPLMEAGLIGPVVLKTGIAWDI